MSVPPLTAPQTPVGPQIPWFFEDCTVTAVSPLRIKRDGDDQALPFEPLSLVPLGSLEVDDRVRVEFIGGRVIIHGRADGAGSIDATPWSWVLRDGDGRASITPGITADNIAAVGQIPGCNLAINSLFRTNQEGYTSGTDLASGAYAFDGWKATTANSRLNFTANTNHGQQVTIPSGDSWAQDIERANVPAGTYTLSWDGTAQARVYNVGGSAPAYTDGPITVTLDGSTNVRLEFGPGTVWKVKFEQGAAATAYVPETASIETLRCYRYLQVIAPGADLVAVGFGSGLSATQAGIVVPFAVEMRAAPTFSSSASTGFTLRGGAATVTVNAGFTLNAAGTRNAVLLAGVSSGLTAGDAYWLRTNSAGNQYLKFDARL